MKKIICILVLIAMISPMNVSATEISAPDAPYGAQEFMPEKDETFAQGLWHIIKKAIEKFEPSVAEALGICLTIITVMIFLTFTQSMSAQTQRTAELAGVIAISLIFLQSAKSMILLGSETVKDLTEYEKLFLPAITAAMAAQGYVTTSTALYTGTAIFNTVLSGLISGVLIPILYVYICICIANRAFNEKLLDSMSGFVKWLLTWGLKIILYVFTGYISITGVIGGSADATAVKTAKIALSGVVPVVGSIISDASEAVLVGAGVVKNSVGIYGLFAIISIYIGPFIQIGTHYLLLKGTSAVSSALGNKKCALLLCDFTSGMGILLAMSGTLCLLLLISTVCFMKGAL